MFTHSTCDRILYYGCWVFGGRSALVGRSRSSSKTLGVGFVDYRRGDLGYHSIKSTRRNFMADLDSELLTSLSLEELQALAEGILAPTLQTRLDRLLEQGTEHPLSPDEEAALDRMLLQIDQLNILKTRARFTLSHLSRASAVA
jgi:hypothetical protein